MYLQITTRCNMTCPHCCFDCKEEGEDMSLATAIKAMECFGDEYVTIGGGEPTLNPNFNAILLEVISASEYVHIVTNGTNEKAALLLAKLTKKEVLTAVLSFDDFHDPVSDEVLYAFEGRYNENTSKRLTRSGRALKNEEQLTNMGWEMVDDCACEDLFILPNGDIKQCGCLDSPIIGNVWRPFVCPENDMSECHKQKRKIS